MPRFSQKCRSCDWQNLDIILTPGEEFRCPLCNGTTEHFYPIGSTSASVADDSFIGGKNFKGSLSDKDLVFYSKSEQKEWMKVNGWEAADHFTSAPDTDKNRRQTKWNLPPPAGVDPRPTCMLTPEEQQARREEWLKTEPVNVTPKAAAVVLLDPDATFMVSTTPSTRDIAARVLQGK